MVLCSIVFCSCMDISWTFKIEIYVDIKSCIVLADYIGKISSSASRTFIGSLNK